MDNSLLDTLLPSFEQETYAQAVRLEEGLLIKVLTLVLEREPTIEDYKDCEMIYEVGKHNEYTFCHKRVPLGVIKRGYPEMTADCPPYKYTVTFNHLEK